MLAKIGLILDILGVFLISIDMLKLDIQQKLHIYLKNASSVPLKKIISPKDITENDANNIWSLFFLFFIIVFIVVSITYMVGLINQELEKDLFVYTRFIIVSILIYFIVYISVSYIGAKRERLFSISLKIIQIMNIPFYIIDRIVIPLLSSIVKIILYPVLKFQEKYCEEQLPRLLGVILLITGFILQYISIK